MELVVKCWLTDRKQRVIVTNTTLDWLPVLSGVTQASVLGAYLFVIYKNNIDDIVSSKILKFADDTKNYGQYFFSRRAKYPTNRSNQVDGMVRRMADHV